MLQERMAEQLDQLTADKRGELARISHTVSYRGVSGAGVAKQYVSKKGMDFQVAIQGDPGSSLSYQTVAGSGASRHLL